MLRYIYHLTLCLKHQFHLPWPVVVIQLVWATERDQEGKRREDKVHVLGPVQQPPAGRPREPPAPHLNREVTQGCLCAPRPNKCSTVSSLRSHMT